MIAKGCNMSVRDETGPSEALYIDPTNATFHPVGEWMKNFELEWEMLWLYLTKMAAGGIGEGTGKGQGWKQEHVQKSKWQIMECFN